MSRCLSPDGWRVERGVTISALVPDYDRHDDNALRILGRAKQE